MRYGCCLNWVAGEADGTGAEKAPLLARAGYDYVELSLAHLMRLCPADRERALEPVRASGLACEACNNFFPATIRLTGPSADHRAALGYAASALELARSLGVLVVVFGSGKARTPPEGFPPERARDQLLAFARDLAPLAEEAGIDIAMEHLNRSESDMLTSFADAARFAREVGRPRIRVLLDSYHLELEREPTDAIRSAGSLLAHTHTARITGRTWPRQSTAELRSVFRALAEAGYDGRMSVEASSDDLESDSAVTLALLKGLERESRAAAG